MADVLWIEEDGAAPAGLPYRAVHLDEAVVAFEESPEIKVVVLGQSAAEPLSAARQFAARDPTLEILIVGKKGRLEAMREALQWDPFAGGHSRVVAADAELNDVIEGAAQRTAQRREHGKVVDAAQWALTVKPPPGHRPSPQQYAAAMWSASPVGAVAILRDTLHIVGANDAAVELIEQDELDLIGQPIDEVFPDFESTWKWLSELKEQNKVQRVIPRKSSRGQQIHLEARAIEVDPLRPEVVLLFLWDVTEQVRLEALQMQFIAREREARKAAERASRVREDVLATVSHDLRSPLQTLLTSAKLLETMSAETPELARIAGMVERSTRFMKRLVGDLLDIARVEGRGLSLKIGELSVDEMIQQAAELSRSAAAEKNVHLKVQEPPPGLTIRADADRLVQLLQNLLNNAVKFSPTEESVTIAARQIDDSIRFTVSDHGPGIPPEDVRHLFDDFWQADRSDERGLGLGLAIVRGIVDAHGGEISVDSDPGRGTDIHVRLPK